jgi:hypothetical protein
LTAAVGPEEDGTAGWKCGCMSSVLLVYPPEGLDFRSVGKMPTARFEAREVRKGAKENWPPFATWS